MEEKWPVKERVPKELDIHKQNFKKYKMNLYLSITPSAKIILK